MGTITKIYDIPVTTGDDGRSKIDADIINLILYVNSFGFKASEIKETNEGLIDIKEFKKKVNYIFFNCLMRGPRPWQNKNVVIGEAPDFDMCFDKEKLELSKDYIASLLGEIGDIAKFTDLSILKDGRVWTVLRQDIKKLLALADAAGLIEFDINQNNRYDRDPEITLVK